jgi:hypothetical protein
MAASGGRVTIGNAWRSHDQQVDLYRRKPGLAAKPGSSNHEFGLAADLVFSNAAARRWAHENASRFGLWFPMDYEPWHVQLIGVDRHNAGGGRQIGGGRNAFAQSPDSRFLNPYDRLAQITAGEDPFDPMEQFGRLVQMMSAGDTSDPMLAAPDSSVMDSPSAPTSSPEPDALASAVDDAR